MLTRIVKMSKMSYLNIQNRSQRGSCIDQSLKYIADASDCALALYDLNIYSGQWEVPQQAGRLSN